MCDEARKEQLKDGRRQAGTLGGGEHAVGVELQHGEEGGGGRGRGWQGQKKPQAYIASPKQQEEKGMDG